MKKFGSDREALEFLAGTIVAEAEREAVPLSEIERKMLYSSETDWTLPEMPEVSAEFDRDFDQDEYERKIAGLVRKIEAHGHGHNREEEETWNAAVEKLSEGDRYLLVMLDPSFSATGQQVRPPWDRLKLWLTAFGIVFGIFAVLFLVNRLFGPRFWTVADWVFDRNRFGLLVLSVLLIWAFRAQLRRLFSPIRKRK